MHEYKFVNFSSLRNDIYCDTNRRARLFERYRCFKTRSTDQECNIFHSTYYRFPKDNNFPVVTTVHDFTYELYMRGIRKTIHSLQKNRAIQNSDSIICVSQNTAKDLLNFCDVDDKKIHVIYNGVSEAYKYLNLEEEEFILFVGARAGYKNFELAVKAVAKLSKMKLKIVGGGTLSNSEIKLLTEYLDDKYEYLGKITNEHLNILYNTAYCLIYPSEYEGFGIPLLEAMRAGCPVIAVNRSSIPEVVGNSAILVDRVSIDSLFSALLRVPLNRNELRYKGLLQSQKFSWDKCFSETYDLYKSLC
ncbi:glycosyltransferase family 4 protein [Salmonella enterica]|nr:glycosyltransferase family 1 protein [Salmonella enterica]EEF4120374.1 glycosyltransferase [Salmonella enterica subsp. enterica serovar Barranquilla]ECU8875835.1 glycosyltransferase family 4 protein [Salmonella enterica]EDH2956518.1 glycosyltransferase [Salmonella enterica]EGK6379476.1 glycosyltransferase family 4 protein [Salmonella enterica]